MQFFPQFVSFTVLSTTYGFLRRGHKMVCKKISLPYEIRKKNFLFQNILLIILGGVLGASFSLFYCLDTETVPITLQELSLFVSQRDIFSLILTDALFSSLILICSFFGQKKICYCILFFLKGFCISYLSFLFLRFFHVHGFLFAFLVLLFHSFLLLPLQLVTAFVFSVRPPDRDGRRCFISFLALNSCSVLFCAVLERFCFLLLPSMF